MLPKVGYVRCCGKFYEQSLRTLTSSHGRYLYSSSPRLGKRTLWDRGLEHKNDSCWIPRKLASEGWTKVRGWGEVKVTLPSAKRACATVTGFSPENNVVSEWDFMSYCRFIIQVVSQITWVGSGINVCQIFFLVCFCSLEISVSSFSRNVPCDCWKRVFYSLQHTFFFK